MLSADPITKELPEEWEEIRHYSKQAIDALVFISILFSHHTFISVFARSMTAEMRTSAEGRPGDKVYTNLVYSMQALGLCEYVPGADTIDYNLTPLFKEISIGPLVKRILARKLATTGWKEPGPTIPSHARSTSSAFTLAFITPWGFRSVNFRTGLRGRLLRLRHPQL